MEKCNMESLCKWTYSFAPARYYIEKMRLVIVNISINIECISWKYSHSCTSYMTSPKKYATIYNAIQIIYEYIANCTLNTVRAL